MSLSLGTMNALNFLRETPLDNWLDYFVDPKKVNKLLEQREPGTFTQSIRNVAKFVYVYICVLVKRIEPDAHAQRYDCIIGDLVY